MFRKCCAFTPQVSTRSIKTTIAASATDKSSMFSTNLITVPEAISLFDSKDTVYVDGSWFLSPDRDGRKDYEAGPRIANAVFFDIDDVASKGDELNPKGLPHMMPPKKLFGQVMDALAITPSSNIIIYATKGCGFVSRTFFTFKTMCNPSNEVYLMQGSLDEWIEAGGEVETDAKKSISTSDFENDNEPKYQGAADVKTIASMEEVLDATSSSTTDSIIVDARGAARFKGEAPEPRQGLRGGHMPGSFNVPFFTLLQSDDMNKFKSKEEMTEVFAEAGVDVNTEKKVILSCGSGVTACVLAVALEECGRDAGNTFVYDGSWLEWGADPETPIV